MHRLLERQAHRSGVNLGTLSPPLTTLLDHVSRAYADADQDRYLMERSLAIASREMRDSFEAVRTADQSRFTSIIEAATDLIFTMDTGGRFTSVNAATEQLTGWSRSELIGQSFTSIIAPELVAPLVERLRRRLAGESDTSLFEVDVITKAGERVALEVLPRTLRVAGRPMEILGVGRDMRARRERERFEYLAHHDPLTGLPNRYMLDRVIAQALARRRLGEPVLMFLDLDNFKIVNDTIGHLAGDQVLVTVAELIRAHMRPEDALLRMGGDEFAIVLSETTREAATGAAEAIRHALVATDVAAAGQRFYVGASIGLTVLTPDDDSTKALLRADAAMYQAKRNGRNRVLWDEQSEGSNRQLTEAHEWVQRVRRAIRVDRLRLDFQPICDLVTGAVVHHEALVRLHDSAGRVHSPQFFVGPAEQFGIMSQVDRYVFDEVVKVLGQNPQTSIYMNVSALSLDDASLLQYMAEQLKRRPGLGCQLGIEITETAVVRDFQTAREWMTTLKAHGVRFALDDFGVGFTSLSYIRNLPLDVIKIDGSYVREMVGDAKIQGMVRAIKALADVLQFQTIAESIESARVLTAVRELGIEFGQGFHLGMPAPELVSISKIA